MEIDGQLAPVNFPGLPRLTPYQTEMIAVHMMRGDREATRTLLKSGGTVANINVALFMPSVVNVYQRTVYVRVDR